MKRNGDAKRLGTAFAKALSAALMAGLCAGLLLFAGCKDLFHQEEPKDVYYTVTFNADGGSFSGGSATQTESVMSGGYVWPPEPTRSGYTFGGWYTSTGGSGSQFTSSTAVYRDTTVYAYWTAASLPSNLSLAESLTWVSENAVEGGEYVITLNASESIAPRALSYSGKNVSVTLNGGAAERTISLSSNGSLFTVGSGVTLTLDNNVTLQGRSSNTASLVYVDSGGTLFLKDGAKITGNTGAAPSAAALGGGVNVYGTFTMDGGTISGNTAVAPASDSRSFGGGVNVDYSGTFTMNGGTISGNTAVSYGGGVHVGGGTFTMNGGTISGNYITGSGGGGAGVFFLGNNSFIMDGGIITNNISESRGAGVLVYSGDFTMNGGTISNNTAGGYGGGVAVEGAFTQSGGTISGNSATYGGGVYVYSDGAFAKQSGGVIYGSNADSGLKNTATSGDSYGHAVYVYSGSKKRNTTAGAGVTLNSATSGAAGGWEETMPNNLSLSDTLAWVSNNAVEGGEYTITVSANEAIAPRSLSYSGKKVSVTLKGDSAERTVSSTATGCLFTVESGATLILDNNLTLEGRSDNTSALVRMNSGGTLVMNAGSKISGNASDPDSYGSGVYVWGGTFAMNGGTISGNTAINYGGGVCVSGGTFDMSGGTISGNIAGSYGGGVCVFGGTFDMSGGTISGNTSNYGGGVHIYSGTFDMSGGTISGNTGSGFGGGVYVSSSGAFTKQSGGVIYGSNADSGLKNTATSGDSYGHAVYVNSGSKKRNSTAGSGVRLDSSKTISEGGGWED